MLSYFYSKTEKTSRRQFKEDFGEFPPAPLTSVELPFHFDIVRVRALGSSAIGIYSGGKY